MKKYIHSILVLVLFALVGCVKTDELGGDHIRSNSVLLKINTTSGIVSRAIEDTPLEERVDWVDVFVFNADADKTVFHKERIDVSSAPVYKTGEFPLQKKRDDFGKDTPYYIYLVANASADLTSAEAGVNDWSDLQALVQVDNNLHLSAFVDGEGKPAFASAPARFLMDGFAYVTQSAESTVPPAEMGTCLVNNSDVEEIFLCGTIYRAAAKFIINIKQGANVEFQKSIYDDIDGIDKTPQYYINQLPVSTKVLPEGANEYYHPTTQNTATQGLNSYTFLWNDDNSMTIIGYGYADDWSTLEYTKQTSMVFNIPMKWDKDKSASNGREELSADNWYKIPLSKSKSFKRNTCYTIDITISTEGAEEKEYAIELKDIEYTTQPWVTTNVGIGGYDAAYLTLNTDLVKIYDTNIDKDQLTFTSSSPIVSIVLKDTFSHNEQNGSFEQGGAVIGADGLPTGEYTGTDGLYAYYIDKFGQKIQLGTDPGFDIKVIEQPEWTKADILAKELNLYKKEGVADDAQYIRAEVWDEHKRALNGNITIHSPILPVEDNEDLNWPSHFNTVRYLEFEVTNQQGIKAIFRVEQIPLTVISNEEGFYSYRDDHVLTDDPNETPTHYLNYKSDFKSFMTSAMHLIHPHDFTDEPKTEEWINTPQADRNYKTWWVKPDGSYPWLNNTTNQCPVQGTGDLMWVEIRYGFYTNNVTWNNGKNSGSYSGIYRCADGQRPYPDNHYFFRERFAGTGITKTDIQGSPFGPYYELEVEIDGVKQTRILRDHYLWQALPIFWSKFVGDYYKEAGNSRYFSDAPRKAGQVDIHEYGPADSDDSKKWGKYKYSTHLKNYANNRMYNIQAMSTSNEYVIGFPKLNSDGKIINNTNNSFMVSPNISLASQLGETCHQQFKDYIANNQPNYIMPNIKDWYYIAERQCDNYVETTFIDKNGNHLWDEGEEIIEYHDWRLPTKAEISAIIEFQESSRAMDKVLSAQHYYCITGTADSNDLSNIYNWVSAEVKDYTNKGYYVRCVRDVNRKK